MVLKIDVECAVGFNYPNRAQRISPIADERGLSALLKHGASPKERDRGGNENN